jgi:hypothetical protein
MSCYAAVALAAYFQFSGKVRLALWIFLAGLAVKTWIHRKRLGE